MELVVFNLYIGSITYLMAFVFAFLVMRANTFRWVSFLIFIILTVVIGLFGSFLVWGVWPATFDIMFGPIHLPTFIVLLITNPVLLWGFGNKIRLIKPQ